MRCTSGRALRSVQAFLRDCIALPVRGTALHTRRGVRLPLGRFHQNTANAFDQRFHGEGFVEKRRCSQVDGQVGESSRTRYENDLGGRLHFPNLLHHFRAGNGHDDVGQDQINLVFVAQKRCQAHLSIEGFQRTIAVHTEHV
jgi:hypothetical protein